MLTITDYLGSKTRHCVARSESNLSYFSSCFSSLIFLCRLFISGFHLHFLSLWRPRSCFQMMALHRKGKTKTEDKKTEEEK